MHEASDDDLKDHHTEVESSSQNSSAAAADANDGSPEQLQKDTTADVSEKAAISNECKDDTSLDNNNDKSNGKEEELSPDEEKSFPPNNSSEMLSLIPKILRSVVERSCHAEELIREGNIVVATNDEIDSNNDNDDDEQDIVGPTMAKSKEQPKNSSKSHSPSSPPHQQELLNLGGKRSNYASKTLSSSSSNYNATATSYTNNARNKSEEDNLFNVEYNECSLLALANWAMMDVHSASATAAAPSSSSARGNNHHHHHHHSNNDNKQNQSSTTPPPPPLWTATAWAQYKKEQEKLHATSITKYNMPIPPPSAFRMCGVCGCFGHYEVECDLLVDYNDGNNDDGGGDNDGGANDDGDGDEAKKGKKRKRLDEETKKKVLSTLAKEIRIQRTLQRLLNIARREEVAKKKMMKRSNHHHHRLNDNSDDDNGSNNNNDDDDDDDDDDASYWVTSQRCNVCLSALGDQSMLVCDGCDELYHMHCLDPPLHAVPEGDWFCDTCQAYDDDISSTVDVEGCVDFVIEQRKRSLVDEEKKRRRRSGSSGGEEECVGVSLGGDNPWIAALSVLTQKEPDVVDMANFKALYMRRDGDDGGCSSGTAEFVANEVVWAKRQFGHIKYWPGIVSKVAKKGLDVKYFPLDDNNLDRLHHQSELLPFFPYFEDLGYDQVMTHHLFHRAVELSVIKTGLKTLGQALNYARCGTQMSLKRGGNEVRNTTAARILKSAGWIAPIGWENADVDEVDGIMIVARDDGGDNKKPRPTSPINNPAKSGNNSANDDSGSDSDKNDECEICHETGDLLICDGGDNGGGCDKSFHIACINRDEIPPGDWICMTCSNELGFKVGVEGHEWGSDDAIQKTDTNNKATAEFCVNEIVGSIVSWQQVSRPKVCYGMVLSVDVEAKTALLRAIPILSNCAGSYERLFSSQPFTQADKSIQIRANDIGSTMWMPLSQLSFVSGRAAEKDSSEFTETLVSHMAHEQESFQSRCREAEIERERFMVELGHRVPEAGTHNYQSTASLPIRSVLPIAPPAPPAPVPPPAYSRQSSSASGLMVVGKTPSGLLQCPKCSFVTEHRCGMANHAKYCLNGRDYTYAA